MEDIQKTIKKLDLKQNAIKILINSIYGAFGNKWFYFYNPDIAQSITLQGQDLIKFSIKAVNHYFMEKWHLDTDLHRQLGIDQYNIVKVDDEAAIYTDTDSIYVQFDSAIRSIQGYEPDTEEALNLCIAIDNLRLSSYFDTCFEKYGKVFNTKNRLKFKLENLSERGLWLKKKNYVIKVAYEPNSTMETIPKDKRYLVIKGLDSIKGSYPVWSRNHLKKLTEYLLSLGRTLDLEKDLVPKLLELKQEFSTLSIDDMAFNFNIRVYNKYIGSEEKLELKKGISIYPRAAAYHNHLLIKSGLDQKYSKIREKDKIKFYYCAPNEHNFDVFAYVPQTFPAEIAPQIDFDMQFFSLIVEPINKQLIAMGVNLLDPTLNRVVDFAKTKTKKEIKDSDFFPLYVINRVTLETSEVPEKFWKVIGNPEVKVADDDFGEYLATITKYGLNSTIVPKIDLEKYKKKLIKKLAEPVVEEEEEVEE